MPPTLKLVIFVAACSQAPNTDATDDTQDTPPTTDSPTTPTDIDTGAAETGTTPTDTGEDHTAETGRTEDTGSTTTTAPPVECESLSGEPTSITQLGAPRASYGIAMNDVGQVLGSDQNSLLAVTYDEVVTVLAPGFRFSLQIASIDQGDLAIALDDLDSIVRFDPETGGQSNIVTDTQAYGLTWGPDGKIWTADGTRVNRVDTLTGATELVWEHAGLAPRVLGFSVDYTRLYIGTTYHGGDLFAIDLDSDHNPVGTAYIWATGLGNWMDCIAVDSCDNIFVCDSTGSRLYRVSPDGTTVDIFVQWTESTYGHGVVFGSGFGGWRKDALYLPQPYNGNTVVEVVIGVGAANAT